MQPSDEAGGGGHVNRPRGPEAAFWTFYAVAAVVALLALVPRLDSFDYVNGRYLWAEDGNVFLNEAGSLGLAAILKPYAGYLHLYPRLVTAVSQLFGLLDRPAILLAGWLLSYLVLVHALLRSVKREHSGTVLVLLLVALVALQPSQGEVFFNITNAQWMLGPALMLYVLAVPDGTDRSLLRCIFLFVLSLTGPFSIILVPALLIRLWLKRDWAGFRYTYVTLFTGAAIQLIVLLLGGRSAQGPLETDPIVWLISTLRLLGFGAGEYLTILAAAAIWGIILYMMVQRARTGRGADPALQTATILLLVALAVIAGGLFAYRHNPSVMALANSGSRYSWIPTILILVSAVILADARRKLAGLVLFLFAVICFVSFQRLEPADLRFSSFARFSEVEDVTIPINPQWPSYPGWHILARRPSTASKVQPQPITLVADSFFAANLEIEVANGKLQGKSLGEDPILILLDNISCQGSAHAGLNIYLKRRDSGWTQLFWSPEGQFDEDDSIWRWYPAGDVKAQFAFPIEAGGTHIRFDPLDKPGPITIKKMELFCL